MFYILRTVDVPFSSIEEKILEASCTTFDEVPDMLGEVRAKWPGCTVQILETLMITSNAKEFPTPKLIPPELQRAGDAWNAMCDRVAKKAKLPKVRSLARYVAPYRTWKRKNPNRDYLLETVASAVEKAEWTHGWIDFGHLFKCNNGTPMAEKILHGQHPDRGRGRRRSAAAESSEFSTNEK